MRLFDFDLFLSFSAKLLSVKIFVLIFSSVIVHLMRICGFFGVWLKFLALKKNGLQVILIRNLFQHENEMEDMWTWKKSSKPNSYARLWRKNCNISVIFITWRPWPRPMIMRVCRPRHLSSMWPLRVRPREWRNIVQCFPWILSR